MKLLFFNGPAKCGKDTAMNAVRNFDNYPPGSVNWHWYKTATGDELKNRTHGAYSILGEYGDGVLPNHYEAVKDVPHEDFFGITPRLAYIEMFKHLARLHGSDILGKIFGQWLKFVTETSNQRNFLVDVGRTSDCAAAVELAGKDNCHLLRITRPGYGFDGDSREWVDPLALGITHTWIDNSGTLEELRTRVLTATSTWMALPPRGEF